MPPRRDRPDPDPAADQRIAKLLARAGVASRREVERMIAEGRVALGGVPVETPATILASLDGVTVDGEPVEAPAPARLFLYHKPAGLLVTERDPGGRPTIYDRLPESLPRVVPVGRLDLATEGLLLLTTDGGLKRQLELPATGVERAYRARAYGEVSQGALEALIEGITIEGVRYGPIDANRERRTGANSWIELVLTEGKNREVRRVLEHLGLRVSRLIRTRYGPFLLADLPPGAVTEVRGHDIASFRKNPTRRDLPQPARQRGATAESARQRGAPVESARQRGATVESARQRGAAVESARQRGAAEPAPHRAAAPEQARSRPVRADAARPGAARATTRPDGDRTASPRGRAAAPRPAPKRAPDGPAGRDRPSRAAPAPAGRREDAGMPGRPAAGRPAAGPKVGEPRAGSRSDRPAEAVAKPARAARARAFREARAPEERAPAPARPPARPPSGPRGGSPRPAVTSGPERPDPDRPASGRPDPGRPDPSRPAPGRPRRAGPRPPRPRP